MFIERIDVYPKEQKNLKVIKSITFKFPIYYTSVCVILQSFNMKLNTTKI